MKRSSILVLLIIIVYLDGKCGMLLFSRMRTSTVETRRRIIIMASMIRPIMLFVHLKKIGHHKNDLMSNWSYQIQAALVICGLFICDFAYMRLKNGLLSGTNPLIYGNPWSFLMWIHYMPAYFWSPYLSNITRSTCTDLIRCSKSIFTYLE